MTVTVLDEQAARRGRVRRHPRRRQGFGRGRRGWCTLDYAPHGARGHVALVGKGITFDSGGLSIKPAAGMEEMKSDMAGAAAVLPTVVAAARLGCPVRVSGWLALAENMPSGTAQRPSDVLTTRGGRTVEVLNTDAEGRLVLADAIVAAGETNPDLIVDVATLTGAQMVALGKRVSAVMANDDALRERIIAAGGRGRRAGLADAAAAGAAPEPRLPGRRHRQHRRALRRHAGRRAVPRRVRRPPRARPRRGRPEGPDAARRPSRRRRRAIPWAHLDIAGPAFNSGSPHGYTPVGGTGVMVRTLLALLEDVGV